MKMNNIVSVLAFGVVLFGNYSCNKREIVPAPEPKVELKNHFFARINGSDVELTQNVNGYSGSSDIDLIVNSSALDTAIYQSTMASQSNFQLARVGHGSLIFDWGTSERPTLSSFETFFTAPVNLQPAFSVRGLSGFVFTYVDISGNEWKSNANHSHLDEHVLYTSIAKESDNSGDYMKFKVEFETYIYRTWYSVFDSLYITDSMLVTDAAYTGWYKR